MPTITEVVPQKTFHRSRPRFNIFLDGTFAFGADEDLVVEQRLIVGKLLNTSQIEKLLFEAEIGKLMERMYRLWSFRPRSERESRDYLKNLSFSQLIINTTIELMKKKQLINDEQFAKDWVNARRKSRQKGKIAIKQELMQKGIAREIIEEVISSQSTAMDEEQLAKQALEKRLKRWESLPILEFKKKTYQFLLRQGFEYSIIKSVVEKALKKLYNKY